MSSLYFDKATHKFGDTANLVVFEIPDDWSMESLKTFVDSDTYKEAYTYSSSFQATGINLTNTAPALAEDYDRANQINP